MRTENITRHTPALEIGTLRTEAHVKAWLAEQETTLVNKLKEGPVVIG
jgi:hypothetical protein